MDRWREDKSRNCNGNCDVFSVILGWSIRLLEKKLGKV